ncbi:PAS domain S-box protein [Bacillus sp. FJAT-45350]|uniref:PAS domain S-box protein n=1 Tax=Bacillus sp. FJAT-45350 TaxID=2011014 RepID=UPI0015CE3385|nr:PAS domain S-box protein [Bacillus sp. FJAT-45350]
MDATLFNSIFEQSAIATAITDLNGNFVHVNQALCEFTGYNKSEIMDQSYTVISHKRDIQINRTQLRMLLKQEETNFQREKQYIHKNGHLMWGLLNVSLILGSKDYNEQKLLIQIKDINKRKEMEQMLVENEKKFRLIAEHSSDIISTFSFDNECKYISKSIQIGLGYNPNKLLEQDIFLNLLHPDEIDEVMAQVKLALPSVTTFTHRLRHKDGRYIWFETKIKTIYDHGRPIEKLAVSRDISRRKKLEDELLVSEERYRSLVESSPETILVFSADDGKILYLNATGYELLGASKSLDLTGYTVWNFMIMDEIEMAESNLYKMLTELTEPIQHTTTLLCLDNKRKLVKSTASAITYKGKTAIQAVVRDITEERKIEEWMKKTEKLSLVGQLAAGVAHEIRNPMTSIKGFIQLAKTTKELKDIYIDIMLTELERTESIIYEFLSLAKPNGATSFQDMNFIIMLQKVITLLETQAMIQDVEILVEYDQVPLIECDENQLKQVFINIIQNAIEASTSKGKIRITVGTDSQHQYTIVRIVDEGCGIPECRLNKLGEPFYSTKEKGTGLGLLVSFNIIDSHQGKINYESKEGQGTSVEVILPVRQSIRELIT